MTRMPHGTQNVMQRDPCVDIFSMYLGGPNSVDTKSSKSIDPDTPYSSAQ